MVNKFANIDVTSEAEKGAALKAQLGINMFITKSIIRWVKHCLVISSY